jgi:hypothetical protein
LTELKHPKHRHQTKPPRPVATAMRSHRAPTCGGYCGTGVSAAAEHAFKRHLNRERKSAYEITENKKPPQVDLGTVFLSIQPAVSAC